MSYITAAHLGSDKIKQMNDLGKGLSFVAANIVSSSAANCVLMINPDTCMRKVRIDFGIPQITQQINVSTST
ncbi:MAG: hypothetical protein J0L93_10340 [Deltaproteobacteria bacterium]|nr:hypothetical protein [Deltaproteobacteria bacterium]